VNHGTARFPERLDLVHSIANHPRQVVGTQYQILSSFLLLQNKVKEIQVKQRGGVY
jgi:hypothetical protein